MEKLSSRGTAYTRGGPAAITKAIPPIPNAFSKTIPVPPSYRENPLGAGSHAVLLPMANLGVKSLFVAGHEVGAVRNTRVLVQEELERLGIIAKHVPNSRTRSRTSAVPYHMQHKSWCKVKTGTGACICGLVNLSAPANAWVRIAGTFESINREIGYAVTAHHLGAHVLANVVNDCIALQSEKFSSEGQRDLVMMLPVLKTSLNGRAGMNAYLHVGEISKPDDSAASDGANQSLEDENDSLPENLPPTETDASSVVATTPESSGIPSIAGTNDPTEQQQPHEEQQNVQQNTDTVPQPIEQSETEQTSDTMKDDPDVEDASDASNPQQAPPPESTEPENTDPIIMAKTPEFKTVAYFGLEKIYASEAKSNKHTYLRAARKRQGWHPLPRITPASAIDETSLLPQLNDQQNMLLIISKGMQKQPSVDFSNDRGKAEKEPEPLRPNSRPKFAPQHQFSMAAILCCDVDSESDLSGRIRSTPSKPTSQRKKVGDFAESVNGKLMQSLNTNLQGLIFEIAEREEKENVSGHESL